MMAKQIRINPTWFDNFVGFFSPAAKANRLKNKYRSFFLENVTRRYEASARGRRTKGWVASSTSANAEIDGALHTIRNRSRELRRNNAIAANVIQAVTANVVGTGLMTQFIGRTKRQQRLIREKWKLWTTTTAIDFEGQMNLLQIQNMVMDAIVESGEVLIRRRRVRPRPGMPFATQIQVLESDFLNDTRIELTKRDNGNQVKQGIEFDNQGRRVAYHLYNEHPGSQYLSLTSSQFDTIVVPAEDVIHAYRSDRPGQTRGVPWLHAVMLTLKDLDEYEDAQLIKQKVSACFAAFIRDGETGDGLTEAEVDEIGQLEPGIIEKLGAGKDITFSNPPRVEGYDEHTKSLLRKIAAGTGLSYEEVTNDYSQVNFSSGRMGKSKQNRNVKAWQKQILVAQVMAKIVDWFVEDCELQGIDTRGLIRNYIPPRKELVDPTREIPAEINAIRGGIKSLEDAILEQGHDPDEFFERVKNTNEKLDELGLVFDSDPRTVNKAGANQIEPPEENGSQNEEID